MPCLWYLKNTHWTSNMLYVRQNLILSMNTWILFRSDNFCHLIFCFRLHRLRRDTAKSTESGSDSPSPKPRYAPMQSVPVDRDITKLSEMRSSLNDIRGSQKLTSLGKSNRANNEENGSVVSVTLNLRCKVNDVGLWPRPLFGLLNICRYERGFCAVETWWHIGSCEKTLRIIVWIWTSFLLNCAALVTFLCLYKLLDYIYFSSRNIQNAK